MSDQGVAIILLAAVAADLFGQNNYGAGAGYYGTYYDDVKCSDSRPIPWADGSTIYPDIICQRTVQR